MKVDVRLERGKVLTYEVPDGTAFGSRVRVPLPWFLNNDSGRLDYPRGMTGVVVGPGTYAGSCLRAVVVEPAMTEAELRETYGK